MLKRLLMSGLLLTILGQSTSNGQGEFTKAFARPVLQEKAVQIKWIAALPEETQYHVLRKTPGEKTFTRLTTVPVRPVNGTLKVDNQAKGPVAEARRKYAEFRKALPKTTNEARLFRQLFAVSAYTDNEFARTAGMYFKDASVMPGQTYQYAISAILKGEEYSWALTDPVKAGDYQPEKAPVGLKVKQESTRRIALNWTIRPDVLAYDVYRRRGNGTDVKLNTKPVIVIEAVNSKSPSSQFTDTDSTLREGETYYYRIAALDPFVIPGEKSQPAWLTIKDMEPPTGVANLQGRLVKKNRSAKLDTLTLPRLCWLPSFSG